MDLMSDRYYKCTMKSKTPAPSDVADKFMLRLPDGMRDELKSVAASNGRSVNAEIVQRLRDSLDAAPPSSRSLGPYEVMAISREEFDALIGDVREIKNAVKVID